MAFVKQSEAKAYLHGHWHTAIAVQALVYGTEIVLVVALAVYGNTPLKLGCLLLIDLLMLSPLKAGRAFFFETLTADRDAATLSRLFRYYRCGYGKAVGWRLITWGQRLLLSMLCYPPSLFLLACSRALTADTPTQKESLIALLCFFFGILLALLTACIIELLLLRLQPLPYLLSHSGSLRKALALSRHITKGRCGTLARLRLNHLSGTVASLLILPLPIASSLRQTATAATVRRFLTQKPKENGAHLLQRRKKCGRMAR